MIRFNPGTFSNYSIVIGYFVLAFMGAFIHELWRDELQAWQIAATADSISQFYNNFNYEGHPPLWHFCLFLLSRFTKDPFYMQIFQAAVATTSVFVLVNYSPFSFLQKLMLSFGYFSLFEYGIISRSYSLGLLLVFIFCAVYLKKNNSIVLLYLILALLSNTSIYGIILSCGLVVFIVLDGYYKKEFVRYGNSSSGLSLFIFIAGLSIALLFISKIDNYELETDIHSEVSLTTLWYRLSTTTNSFLVVPDYREAKFWETNFLNNVDSFMLFAVLNLALIGFFAYLFFKDKAVGFFYTISVSLVLIFILFVHHGFIRHLGHLWMVLVVSMWFLRSRNTETENDKTFLTTAFVYVFNGILFLQFCSGIISYCQDYKRPFSNYESIGKYILEQKKSNVIISGNLIYAALAAYMPGEKIFILRHQKFENKYEPSRRVEPSITDSLITAAVIKNHKIEKGTLLILGKSDFEKKGLILADFILKKEFYDTESISIHDEEVRVYEWSKE